MLFDSPVFALFFLAYLILHSLAPGRFRIWLVIVGGLVFYSYWNWAYTGLPLGMALIAAFTTKCILAGSPEHVPQRMFVGVAAIAAPLVFFKYANFLWLDVVGPLATVIGWQVAGEVETFRLPLSISFVTFTLIAYLVDVATGKFPHRVALKWVLGYVMFFPHLIAGPILRPHELISQLRRQMPLRRRNLLPGLALFASGLVKKMVFADPLGTVVGSVYDHPSGHTLPEYLLALYGFSVQIYCDFSGYTDMALGTAQILGVRLPNNFFQPYLATSIATFWRRWHRTLSHWLRDYIYIPLGGSRAGRLKAVRNIMITMVFGGLWHGANWTFVVWGFLHGLGVAANHAISRPAAAWARPPRWLGIVVTFHLVTFLWIFFRASDLTSARQIIAGCLGAAPLGDVNIFLVDHAFECALIALFFVIHPWDDARRLRAAARRGNRAVIAAVIVGAIALVTAFGTGSSAQFIYFEF